MKRQKQFVEMNRVAFFRKKKLVNDIFLVSHIGSKSTPFKWNYLGCFPLNSLAVTVLHERNTIKLSEGTGNSPQKFQLYLEI